jgi:DNA-binding GntR family transcriptional regulator
MADRVRQVRPAPERIAVRAGSAAALVYAALRGRIISMELVPGTQLSEKDIAESWGCSRTPVREALGRLSEERLVDVYPQIGTFVARISLEAVRDALVIRQLLERTTAREAALRAGRTDVRELKVLVTAQSRADRAGALIEFHRADESFHAKIAAIAGHPNIWRVVKREKVHIDRFRVLTLPMPGRRREVIAQHKRILDAILASNPDLAEDAMRSHLSDLIPASQAVQTRFPDYFASEEEIAAGEGCHVEATRDRDPRE